MKPIVSLFAGLALSLLAFLPSPALAGGPMPWTQNQFPVYYLTVNTNNVTPSTGTTEATLASVSIPAQALGNNGMLRVTVFPYSPDGNANASYTYKLRVASTTGTTLMSITLTNMVTAGPGCFQAVTFPVNGQTANTTVLASWQAPGGTGTPYPLTATQGILQTFGTSTNWNLLIDAAGGASTNVCTLQGALVEVLSMP